MVYSEPNIYGKLFWYIKNKQNGSVASGVVDGGPVNVPGSSVFLFPKIWRASDANVGGQVASMLISHVSLEVD